MEGIVGSKTVLISAPGKPGLLGGKWRGQVENLESAGKTVVVVAEDGVPIGLLALRDTLRSDAKQAIAELNVLGVHGVVLTGDNSRAAAAIASKLALDYRAGLLPEDKLRVVTELSRQRPTTMIGDSINDAPAMKAASIGIAMGSGSGAALETADAALTHSRLLAVAEMIRIVRYPRQYPAEHHHCVGAERGIPDHQSAGVDRIMASSAGGFRCHRAGDSERAALAEKASLRPLGPGYSPYNAKYAGYMPLRSR